MYDKIVRNNDSVLCSNCWCENIPFQDINDIQLSAINKDIEINSETLYEVLIKFSTPTNLFREVNDSSSIQQPLGLEYDESDCI